MRLAVTGTPGTGKTTATERLADLLEERGEESTDAMDADVDGPGRDATEIVHLNDVIESESLYSDVDEGRDSVIADLDALESYVEDREPLVVESHLAHHLPADRVVVLRCDPTDLESRLRDRGESEDKARENAESEALDVILSEAVDAHGLDAVYEIDTTDRSPGAVAEAIADVLTGDREPSAGTVDFVGYLQ